MSKKPAQARKDESSSDTFTDRLEGRHPVREALKAGRPVDKVWVARQRGTPDPGLQRMIQSAREAGATILEVDKQVLDQMAGTHNHQGVIAQVAAHTYWQLELLIDTAYQKNSHPLLLILAELKDSYNLGSILRVADAAGVDGIIIPQRRSVTLNAAVAKASAGAIEHVPVARVTNLSRTLIQLKERGFWISGTDASGPVSYEQADWQGPLAVVIGSEGEGLSPSLRNHCDFLVSIPMSGQINSLNAAVATGIVIFEAVRQRRLAASDANK